MNSNRAAMVVGAMLIVGALVARWSRHDVAVPAGQIDVPGQPFGLDPGPLPPNLAKLVEYSSDIVVARYNSSANGSTLTLATASSQGEPPEEAPVLNTEVEVDEVLKGDLDVDETIVYSVFGALPITSSEISADASSSFPVLWPEDTEFVLFLDKQSPEVDWYYLIAGACSRILTDQSTVSCSDGDRTVPSFMSGLSRQALIDAIVDEVEDPSSTITPRPSLTPEPTETPCSGPGC